VAATLMLTLLCLSRPASASSGPAQPETQVAQETGAEALEASEAEAQVEAPRDPVAELQQARSHYERGEFELAALAFASVLDSPVKVRTRQDLHEGFLYYAFTLLLQGGSQATGAAEKLRYALRLDPDYLPSPVTTRPDILAFYNRQRDAYISANGPVSEPPQIIFPELQGSATSTRVLRRRWFVPAFGVGLRFLGHRRAGDTLMATEISALGLNVASLLIRVAALEDLSPAGFAATEIGRYTNYISFSVFWIALVVDVVVSLALRRSYELHPERRPARRTETGNKGPGPARLKLSPGGLRLEFW